MKRILLVVAMLLWTGQASAAMITTLYGSGVDDGGILLGDGATDGHYTFVAGSSSSVGAAYVVSRIGGGWATLTGSRWISSSADNAGISGIYTTTFDLAGFDHTTANVFGLVAYDDDLVIYLNGSKVYENLENAWSAPRSFSIADKFVSGLNTLSFYVANTGGGPTGLNVALRGTASPVPIPGAVWMLGTGLLALLGVRRKIAA